MKYIFSIQIIFTLLIWCGFSQCAGHKTNEDTTTPPTKTDAVIARNDPKKLVRYTSLLDRNNVTEWESNPARSFDKDGIILNNEDYHPVGIIQYGMLCLDQFKLTSDSTYFFKMKAQAEYLLSDKHLHLLYDGTGIGLPYNFEYNGLKPPWYSGMAQGMGISFLLRYNQIVKDTRTKTRIKQIKTVLLHPQEDGGCISKTPEGLIWIEEYPNSDQSPQVLNGFIFALFGLMEYVSIFPEDVRAARMSKDCLASLKQLLPLYDTRKWTNYNRRKIYPNRLNYIQLQIFQMRQLFAMTQDPFYTRQLLIWAAFTSGQIQDDANPNWHFHKQSFAVFATLTNDTIRPEPSKIVYNNFEKSRIDRGFVNPLPWYGIMSTNDFSVTEQKTFVVSLDSTASDVHVLYRYHWDPLLLNTEKWTAANGVSANHHTFQLSPGSYQFAVFYRMKKPDSVLPVYQLGLE